MSTVKVVLCALYSRMSMAGESHGVSVLGGVLATHPKVGLENVKIFDMYASEECDRENEFINLLRVFKPDVLGISCPYGGFEFIKELYPKLSPYLSQCKLKILGGALPSFVPERMMEVTDKDAVCILGEGEEALPMLIDSLFSKVDYKDIPNLCYFESGGFVYTARKQVDLSNVPPPYREHIPSLVRRNAQIFAEYSRGCSWGACSFCSRHMYRDNFKPTCYRTFLIDRLKGDLKKLVSLGVTSLTFADEDFCGSGLFQLKEVTEMFEELMFHIQFDVTMNVRAVYRESWSSEDKLYSQTLFRRLKACGLNKVFLGVETGSPTQIKRFRKAQTVEESINAINLLRNEGIEVDLGFVMFDPLCTVKEVQESIDFLRENDLAGITSSLGSELELWIHKDSRFKLLMDKYFSENNIRLYSPMYRDEDLVHESTYADDKVKLLGQFVKDANMSIKTIYYTIKILMRNGKKDSLGIYVGYIRGVITDIRKIYLDYLHKYAYYPSITEDTRMIILQEFRDSMYNYFREHKDIFKQIALDTNNSQLDSALRTYFGELY